MSVLAEDVALPVQPDVGMQVGAVPQKLQAHLGVLREVCLGIEERFDEAVVLSAVDIAEHDGKATEVGLRTEPGKHMRPPAVLGAFPQGDVVVDVVRIAVGTVEDECLQSESDLNLPEGHVGQLGLHPQSWQRVAVRQRARVLVVAEETDALQLYAQGTHVGCVQSVGRCGELLPHPVLCAQSGHFPHEENEH